ncbi:MAG: trypsin-like peptidase domain-containing protein, partial [Clostridia bacterium]|nr:trypsin-like peptidase domain-containing protein [Clostridia bacterium]
MVGVGFGRTVRAKAALAREQAQTVPSQKATLPVLPTPEATPRATPEVKPVPTRSPELSAQPTVDPGILEALPKLELNIQQSDEMKTFASIPDVVEAASESVVGIIHYQPNPRTGKLEEYASGSGFIVSENGYVLTNAHVVTGAAAVDVLFSDGEKTPALVVGTDVTTDIAVLKMEGEGYP